MNLKAIVFDFDGVIVNSNELKEKAYFEILPKEDHGLVKNIFNRNDVVQTRVGVFKVLFAEKGLTGGELEKKVASSAAGYNNFVQDEMEKIGVSRETVAALESLSQKYNLYINSFTPDYAILETVKRMNLGKLFKKVYGRASLDSKKEEVLLRIMKDENVSGNEILFVGDAESDREAARNAGCNFVGMANAWNGWEKKDFLLVSSVGELPEFIAKNYG